MINSFVYSLSYLESQVRVTELYMSFHLNSAVIFTWADRIRNKHYFVFVYLNANTEESECVALSSFCAASDNNNSLAGYGRL